MKISLDFNPEKEWDIECILNEFENQPLRKQGSTEIGGIIHIKKEAGTLPV